MTIFTKNWVVVACAASMLLGAGAAAQAQGNMAARPERLELAIDTRALSFSNTEYTLQTGSYYFWDISHDGMEELMVQAPDLFRNSWVNQISINDIEVHTSGAIFGVEFDDAGTASISFIPVRPGNYEFFAPGFQDRGLSGTFVVR